RHLRMLHKSITLILI
ncbi:hypothetical protein D047_3667B, partial [Vibrio parahaemolyticus VPTS-2010_2]